MNQLLKIGTLFLLVILVSSCDDSDDSKVFAAQKCLNELSASASEAEALACYNKVEGVQSKAAYTIRCGAKLVEGGLNDNKIQQAFSYFEDNSKNDSNSQAQLMVLLNLRSLAVANQAVVDCQKSEVDGNIFIASAAAAGTAIGAIVPGIDFDSIAADPSSIEAQLSNIDSDLTNCVSNNNCDTEAQATVEVAVSAVAGTYCESSEESDKDEFCDKIDQAIASDNTYEAFLCAVQGKSYASGECVSP